MNGEPINFGELPPEVDELLQRGVAAYRRDRREADRFFRKALETDPQVLPTYYCLYKIHTYQGNLDEALAVARAGFCEAARQAGLSSDYRAWQPGTISMQGADRFALYTLKALAFIHLRRDEGENAHEILAELARLDPEGLVGWTVIAELAQGSISASQP